MAPPLFVGYSGENVYPGGKMKRTPRGGGYKPPAPEYKFIVDQINQYINSAGSVLDAEGLPITPKWWKDKILLDLQKELKAAANPMDYSTQTLEQAAGEEGERGVMGAFGIDLSLNPADYIEDPKTAVVDTLKKWGKNAINLEDLETRYYTELWERVSGAQDGTQVNLAINQNFLDKIANRADAIAMESLENRPLKRAIGLATKDQLFENPTAPNGSPLWLSNLGVKRTTDMVPEKASYLLQEQRDAAGNMIMDATGNPIFDIVEQGVPVEKDVYETYRKSAIDFKRFVKGYGTRDDGYTSSMQDFSYAIATDIDMQQKAAGSWDAFFRQNTKIDMTTVEGQKLAATAKTTIMGFSEKTRLAELIGNAESKYGGSSNVVLALGKYASEGNTAVHAAEVTKALGDYKTKLDKVEQQINKIEAIYTGGAGAGLMQDQESLDKFRKITDGYRQRIADMKAFEIDPSVLAQLDGGGVAGQAAAREIMGKFNSLKNGGITGRTITGGNAARSSFQMQVLMDLENDALFTSKKTGSMGWVINQFNHESAFRMKRVQVIQADVHLERAASAAEELTKVIEKGNFNNYVWEKVRYRINGWTPAYNANLMLKKAHYFGLVVDPTAEPITPYKWADKLFRTYTDSTGNVMQGKFSKLTKHTFDINIEVGGRTLRLDTEASKDLKSAGILYASLNGKGGEINKDAMKLLLSLDGGKYQTLEQAMADPAFINALYTANGGKFPFPWGATKFNEFKDEFAKYRSWAKNSFDKLGLNGDQLINDGDAMLSLTSGLGKYNASFDTFKITMTHIGFMQKLVAFFNKIQTRILLRFRKVLNPLLGYKVAITETVTNAILAGLTTLTGGLGIMAYPLKLIIQSFVGKVTGLADSLIKGIFKLDLSDFNKQFSKTMDQSFRMIGFLILIPLACCMIPMMGILLFVTSIFGGATGTGGGIDIDPNLGRVERGESNVGKSIADPGTCFFEAGQSYGITTGTRDNAAGVSFPGSVPNPLSGHGTDGYMGGTCTTAVPVGWIYDGGWIYNMDPGTSASLVRNCRAPNGSPYYGLAIDIVNFSDRGSNVYAPSIPTQGITSWISEGVHSMSSICRGDAIVLKGTGTDGTIYEIAVLHLAAIPYNIQAPGSIVNAGDLIGTIFNQWRTSFNCTGELSGGNSHLHIEETVNSTGTEEVVPPRFCGYN